MNKHLKEEIMRNHLEDIEREEEFEDIDLEEIMRKHLEDLEREEEFEDEPLNRLLSSLRDNLKQCRTTYLVICSAASQLVHEINTEKASEKWDKLAAKWDNLKTDLDNLMSEVECFFEETYGVDKGFKNEEDD